MGYVTRPPLRPARVTKQNTEIRFDNLSEKNRRSSGGCAGGWWVPLSFLARIIIVAGPA